MSDSLTLTPIGFIRTGKQVKFAARHQPAEGEKERNVLELRPGSNFEQALRDLEGFERVWLLWWFHRNTRWHPIVLPPRGPAARRGVFATRSPHRPNPLGMTPVRLLGVEGRTLTLGPCDLMDGTPVLDIKPYVAAYDAFPGAKAGWIDAVDEAARRTERFAVAFRGRAEEQLAWLLGQGIDFRARLTELLGRDPSPHRTRRITRRKSGAFMIGCGAWRAFFVVEGEIVTVTEINPGYPARALARTDGETVPDRAAQIAFLGLWPEEEGEAG